MNQQMEEQFNEMIETWYEEQKDRLSGEDIAGQPDGYEGEPTIVDNKSHDTKNEDEITKMLECALGTEEYLAYLKGMKFRAMFKNNSFMVGYYISKRKKFILENTP